MPLPLVLSSLLLMKACLFGEKPLILTLLAQAVTDTQHIRWTDLGLDPVLLSIRGHAILRWYSLAYIGGILIGWWYLLKLLEQPGAPMAKRHADDLVFYRSEEHTSELQSLMRTSYAVFCLKKKTHPNTNHTKLCYPITFYN